MRIELSRTEGRLALLGLAAFGLVHVLVPRLLLRAAHAAYGLALDVEFTPRESASRRVRLVGLGSLVAWAIGRRVLGRTDGSIGGQVGPAPAPRSHAHRSTDDR